MKAKRRLVLSAFLILSATSTLVSLVATSAVRPVEENVIGKKLTLFSFQDSDGKSHEVADLMQGKPLIIHPFFVNCESFCLRMTDILKRELQESKIPLSDYNVLSFTLSKTETPKDLKKYIKKWDLPKNWVVGKLDQTTLFRLLDELDFRIFTKSPGEIDHPDMIYVINAAGKVSAILESKDVEPLKIKKAF